MSYEIFVKYMVALAAKSHTWVTVQNDREKGRYIARFSGGVKMIVNHGSYKALTVWANGTHRAVKDLKMEVACYG